MKQTFINKIPPDYVERTLARLLPPATEIEQLDPTQLYELHRKVGEYRKLIKTEPVKFYMPNPGGQWDFMTLDDPRIRVQLFIAGNKTGKTTAGAVKMAEFMAGQHLWGHDFRPAKTYKVPSYGCVFAEDFDSHKEVTLPNYLSWCPKALIKSINRNPAGSVVSIDHKNGAILFFRTYEQGGDKAEGKDWDVVWCDEPPPREVYTAVLRGLVTLNGVFFITATLLKETWLYDEAEDKNFVKSFGSSIEDNPWISDQARKDFIESLSDDEREVRASGKPVSLTGRVYKEFTESPPFLIPDQEFQNDWPVVMGVDPHERKPIHVLWATITPNSEIIVFDWALIKARVIEDIHQELISIEARHTMPAVLCVMDPNRGRARQLGDKSWEDVFNDFGYPVMFTEDNLKIGHTQVHTYLAPRDNPRRPAIRFTEKCRGKGGPVHQMLRYAWASWARRKSNVEKDVLEKPKETNKDFPDIIRYMCLAGLDFDTLKYGPRVIERDLKQTYRMGIRAGL